MPCAEHKIGLGEGALPYRVMTAHPGDEVGRESLPEELAGVAEENTRLPQAGEPNEHRGAGGRAELHRAGSEVTRSLLCRRVKGRGRGCRDMAARRWPLGL